MTGTLLVLAGLAATATAHGHVAKINVGGKDYEGFDAPSYQSTKLPAPLIAWNTAAGDNGYVPPSNFSSPDIICHKSATPGGTHAPVAGGGKVVLTWNTWPPSHSGPIIDYLAACPGNCETVDKTSL